MRGGAPQEHPELRIRLGEVKEIQILLLLEMGINIAKNSNLSLQQRENSHLVSTSKRKEHFGGIGRLGFYSVFCLMSCVISGRWPNLSGPVFSRADCHRLVTSSGWDHSWVTGQL